MTQDAEWRQLWDERGRAVGRALGETVLLAEVISFSWTEFILPGACGLTFSGQMLPDHTIRT